MIFAKAAASSSAIAALVASSFFASSSASPIKRTAQSECKSLGKGPLGYNATGIPIYSKKAPQDYLIFTEGDDPNLTTSPLPKADEPEMFEFFSCNQTAPALYKGDVVYYQGYITDTLSRCLTITSLESQHGNFVLANCSYDDSRITGVGPKQSFQVTTDTFYDYHAVNFLGRDQNPKKVGFGSGGDYRYSLVQDNMNTAVKQVNVHYKPDEPRTGRTMNHSIILQLGNEYDPSEA